MAAINVRFDCMVITPGAAVLYPQIDFPKGLLSLNSDRRPGPMRASANSDRRPGPMRASAMRLAPVLRLGDARLRVASQLVPLAELGRGARVSPRVQVHHPGFSNLCFEAIRWQAV